MKRKAILSVLLGAVTLVTVGYTESIDNQTKNGENNTKIVEDNNSIKNPSDNNKSKDDNIKEKEEKVNQPNNKEENKTGTSISKSEKNKDKLVEANDTKTSNKASENNSKRIESNSKKVEDDSNKKSDTTSNDEAKPKVQRNYSNNTNNQKNNSNVNNTNNNVTNESSYMSAVESEIISIVNSERAKAGKKALSYNATMQSYGRQKSKDMAINNYFSHEDLSNRTEYDKMKANGVKINAWGENIAYMSNRSPKVLAREFMNNWMNSPGHRANILSNNFTGIGVGVYKYGDKIYATQEFCA